MRPITIIRSEAMTTNIFTLPIKHTFVKICGISNLDDARICAAAGADAVGIFLEKGSGLHSPDSDRISITAASALVRCLPPGLASVLVMHTDDAEVIGNICLQIFPNAVQLQKDIGRSQLSAIKRQVPQVALIKTIYVNNQLDFESRIQEANELFELRLIDAVLLDSARGGSGEVHDWKVSSAAAVSLKNIPVILAGGLSADNVREAINCVNPWGVDVMSSVTSGCRNKKDETRVRGFLRAVHENT
jgi:phosphoribosylanthranilate isomerase